MVLVRSDANVPQNLKKMKWQVDQIGDKEKLNSEMDF